MPPFSKEKNILNGGVNSIDIGKKYICKRILFFLTNANVLCQLSNIDKSK